MSLYTPYGVQIDTGTAAAAIIGGVTEQSIDTGAEASFDVPAGRETPQYGEINVIQSGGTFRCADISSLWNLIGSRGACLEAGATNGFTLWELQREACGSLASGSVHRTASISNGRVIPRTLSAQQDSRATMTAEVMSIYDGTNDPLVIAETQAAPTGMADEYGFHLGEIVVAGVTIEHTTSLEVNFGIALNPIRDEGETFAKNLHFGEFKPVITITTKDVSKFGDTGGTQIPLRGALSTHANSYFILRRRVIGTGAFSTDPDSIKVTFGGITLWKQNSASGNNPREITLEISTLDDQTNEMLVPDFAYDLSP